MILTRFVYRSMMDGTGIVIDPVLAMSGELVSGFIVTDFLAFTEAATE